MMSFNLIRNRIADTSKVTQRFLSISTASPSSTKNVVVVDGIRLPFSMASTIYQKEMTVDLQRLAIQGLLTKTALDKDCIDYVVCGNVIQEVKTSNIAREAAINCGLPHSVGSHTISQACISANAAICSGAEKIMSGHANVVIAGGVESFSDVPIRLSRPLRQALITLPKAQKKGGPLGAIRHLTKLKLSDIFGLETPAIANYTTGEVMGVSSDKLSAKFGIYREDQDEFSARSHSLAGIAHAEGWYDDEIVPYKTTGRAENGIKSDTTPEKLSKLRAAFVKPHGTHTAANSSFLTDGASASLLMDEETALQLGYQPWAYLRDWSFKGCDPFTELLLGPTYCTADILRRNPKLSFSDVGVLEFHEAFAGQLLSNITAMGSQTFADDHFGGNIVGDVMMEKLNTKGGSLSLGHPFGATGSRLVTTACRRLVEEEEQFAIVAACADGGLGHACLLERYDQ